MQDDNTPPFQRLSEFPGCEKFWISLGIPYFTLIMRAEIFLGLNVDIIQKKEEKHAS
jgi:hypothetical protein